MKTNKGFAPIATLIIIIAVLAVGGVAYYAGTKKSFTTENNNQSQTDQNQNSIENNPIVNPNITTKDTTSGKGVSWSTCSINLSGHACAKAGGETFCGNGWCSCDCPGKPCNSNLDCADSSSVIPPSNEPKYCKFAEGVCGSSPGKCIVNLSATGVSYGGSIVCGCDGKTYATNTEAEKLGISIKSYGGCNAVKPCAKEGEYINKSGSLDTQNECCNFEPELKTKNASLCYDMMKGPPCCDFIGTAQEGWYYFDRGGNKTALKIEKCASVVDYTNYPLPNSCHPISSGN